MISRVGVVAPVDFRRWRSLDANDRPTAILDHADRSRLRRDQRHAKTPTRCRNGSFYEAPVCRRGPVGPSWCSLRVSQAPRAELGTHRLPTTRGRPPTRLMRYYDVVDWRRPHSHVARPRPRSRQDQSPRQPWEAEAAWGRCWVVKMTARIGNVSLWFSRWLPARRIRFRRHRTGHP